MNTITLHKITSIRTQLIDNLKIWGIIKPLQIIFDSTISIKELKNSPEGTVGRDLYLLLKNHNYKLIPKFENHDLKHLILGYDMHTIDEIRMQMFLLGNGNQTLPVLLFALSGVLFPEHWTQFQRDFDRGLRSPTLEGCSIDTLKGFNTKTLKKKFSKNA